MMDDLVSEGADVGTKNGFASIVARANARPSAAGRAGTRGFVCDIRARGRSRAIAASTSPEPARSRVATTGKGKQTLISPVGRGVDATDSRGGRGGRRTDLRGGQGRLSEHGASHGGGAVAQKALHLLRGACGSRARRGVL